MPKHANHFISRAELLKDCGRTKESASDFSTAYSIASSDVQKYPQSAEAYAVMAQALNGLGLYDQALPDAQQAIQRDPNNTYLRLTRAKIFLAKHNPLSAINDLNLCTSVYNKEPEPFLLLANANDDLGNPAIAKFQRTQASILKQEAKNSNQ